VFNRNVELIGQIDFPGSAFSVDVSSDGQYVVGARRRSTPINLQWWAHRVNPASGSSYTDANFYSHSNADRYFGTKIYSRTKARARHHFQDRLRNNEAKAPTAGRSKRPRGVNLEQRRYH